MKKIKKEFQSLSGTSVKCKFKIVDFIDCKDVLDEIVKYSDGMAFKAKVGKPVTARKAVAGEKIETATMALIDGQVCVINEKTHVVTEREEENGDMIVTKRNGESCLVPAECFDEHFKRIREGVRGQGDVYRPLGESKEYVTVTQNICFMNRRGVMEFAPKGSKLCTDNENDIYSITNIDFDALFSITISAYNYSILGQQER